MGKSNRIRSLRAVKAQNRPVVKEKKQMPSWVMTVVTITLIVALLLGVVAMVLNANGVFGRMTTVMSTDNYSFDANMMSYMFNNQYMNIVMNYGGSGYISLDPKKPLKDQQFGNGSYLDSYIFGEFEGTWYDFIVNQTVESAKSILRYCEYAKANNIALDAADKAEIDAAMAEHKKNAAGAASFGSYLAYYYGAGVSEGDVRKCMEYSMLAEKAMDKIEEDIKEGITEEDINKKYTENNTDYDVVDYVYYTFNVSYASIASEVVGKDDPTEAEIQKNSAKILELYKERVAEAKEKAQKAYECADAKAFMEHIYTITAEESARATYLGKTIKDEIKYTESGMTPEQIRDFFIDEIKKDAIANFLDEEKEYTDAVTIPKDDDGKVTVETVEVYGKTVKVGFAEIINSVKNTVYTRLESVEKSYTVEKAKASKDSENKEYNEFSKWAFKIGDKDTAANVGDKKLLSEGAGANGKEITAADKYSYNTVYFITKAQRKDEETAKNLSYITFATETAAKDAITKFTNGGKYTIDAFKELATEKKLTCESLTDYIEGGFGLTDFDTWAYGEETSKNSITATPIKKSSTEYIVGFMEGDGQELWHISVYNSIFSDRASDFNEDVEETYKVNDKGNAAKAIKPINETIFSNV